MAGKSKLKRDASGILDRVSDLCFRLDANWRIVYINAPARHAFTLSEPVEKLGSIWDCLPEFASSFFKPIQRSRSDCRPIICEGYYPPTERWFEAHTFPNDNEILDVLFRDITERKKSQEEIIKQRLHFEKLVAIRTQDSEAARDRALAANKSKSTFLANMSHELRTPLNAIIGYSEMLCETLADDADESARLDVQKIHSAGKHLLSLINDVLDLSKIEAGKMDNYIESFDVLSVVEGVATSIEPLVARNQNELRLDIAPGIGAIRSDLTKVRQILFNLISNANKFTHNGVVAISARLENDELGGWVSFNISDTGIGMSPEQRGRIFEPFVQGDSSTTKKFGGTGLGLAITKRLCNLLGGEVKVQSDVGRGTQFRVRLPVQAPQANEPVRKKWFSIGPKVDPASVRFNPPLKEIADRRSHISTVLVIDDDANVRDLMERFLTRQGFYAVTAANAEEGLLLAKEKRPDVITLDVMMPQRDGWSVLTQLKSDPELADIPVIMLTMIEDKELGLALGAADYLSKPVDQSRLAQVISKYVRMRQQFYILVLEAQSQARSDIESVCERMGVVRRYVNSAEEALAALKEGIPDFIVVDMTIDDGDGLRLMEQLRTNPKWSSINVIATADHDIDDGHAAALNAHLNKLVYRSAADPNQFLTELEALIVAQVRKNVRG